MEVAVLPCNMRIFSFLEFELFDLGDMLDVTIVF
jgi:hypothetical protein